MASRVRITALSAASILVNWITEQGREPRLRECCPANGLLFWRTFTDRIPGITFSATISAARMLVSAIPVPRMQNCLGPGCSTRFVYEGYHFCQPCRVALGYADDDFVRTGVYLRAQDHAIIERVVAPEPVYHVPADDLDEDELWSDADTVTGFDDLIAGQMNAWTRVSRKRRYFRES